MMQSVTRVLFVAASILAASAMLATAQDTALFGTAGTLQDQDGLNPPTPAFYQALTSPEDAADLCLSEVANQYGHSNARVAKITPAGEDKFLVEGSAEAATVDALNFFCRVVHGEVATLHLVKAAGGAPHGSGLLAVRLEGLETTAPAEHIVRHLPHSEPHAVTHDLRHVRSACHHELRRHLAYAFNGPAQKVIIGTAHLRNRTLSGHGQVNWADGGVSRINYNCELDRYGQVVDGAYSYY